MKATETLKMYTLKHFLLYMGIAAIAGAVIGVLANATAWSDGLIYAAGLLVGLAISAIAMREGLFGAPRNRRRAARRRHA